VRLLLERGADPNIRDEGDNAFPIHFAAERGDLPVVRLLVEHGADPIGADTTHELDVLGWATVFGPGERAVVDYLVQHGARWTVPSAVAMGEVAILRELHAANPDAIERPMVRPYAGQRPLHLAVVKRQSAAVAALLDLGADPDAATDDGCTPLHMAIRRAKMGVARLLLERGASPRVRASLRKRLRFTDDEEMHEYRDVTPLAWGERFHDQDWVNREAMRLIAGSG
jgi:ankyrin